MTSPLHQLLITDESTFQNFITDYFGPTPPGPTGAEFLEMVEQDRPASGRPPETIEDLLRDFRNGTTFDPPTSTD